MMEETAPRVTTPTGDWRGLSARVVWVDFAKSVLSLLPAVIAIAVFDVEPSLGAMWPFVAIAVWGVIGAAVDIIRWLFMRYRITDTEVERLTGLFVRRHRSVRRDRIRSVDTHAKLRHRLAGLRVVTIGAGQQTNAGESAFVLDSLTRDHAELLRVSLLRDRASAAGATAARSDEAGDEAVTGDPASPRSAEVLATFRPWWVVYNMFSVWAYLTAAGLLWGAFWLASMFGVDLISVSSRWIPWGELGWFGTAMVALVGGGLFGAIAMGVSFVLSYWRFELARVRTENTSFLRTRRGLLSTREVNRDEARLRGLSVAEPLLWRWMKMADTNVITTGLSIWSPEQPSAVLPPRSQKRRNDRRRPGAGVALASRGAAATSPACRSATTPLVGERHHRRPRRCRRGAGRDRNRAALGTLGGDRGVATGAGRCRRRVPGTRTRDRRRVRRRARWPDEPHHLGPASGRRQHDRRAPVGSAEATRAQHRLSDDGRRVVGL